MPDSTDARSDGGGVASVRAPSEWAAAASSATSARQSAHPDRCCSNASALGVVEGVDRVGAGKVVQVGVHAGTPNVSRRRIRPSRIRVFAVPSGRSSSVATSVWV